MKISNGPERRPFIGIIKEQTDIGSKFYKPGSYSWVLLLIQPQLQDPTIREPFHLHSKLLFSSTLFSLSPPPQSRATPSFASLTQHPPD